ncbi:MAG: NAD(P)H-hydrate dehydratase [Gemmatimonadota bacterium]
MTAGQAAAREVVATAAGTPARELMRRAGEGAAVTILHRYREHAARGVRVFCGPGNNGGDGWIVAAALRRVGVAVEVESVREPATADARWAHSLWSGENGPNVAVPQPGVVVDALLGTGATGRVRMPLAGAVAEIARLRGSGGEGTRVAALDVPSGIDATTGDDGGAVTADLTLTFANVKRGLLAARRQSGGIVVVDIGVPPGTDAPFLTDAATVRAWKPVIPAAAHKGLRRRVLLVGASEGMAGALALSALAAFRSGIGMVRFSCASASIIPLQIVVPQATAQIWPRPGDYEAQTGSEWPHALLLGPGFGADPGARGRALEWLESWRGPVVIDADALSAFAGGGAVARQLAAVLDGREALVTPHEVEAARLLGVTREAIAADRYGAATRLAGETGATVLLKGVPSLIATAAGVVSVCARGTPVLAQGGSGDMLAGIAVTLLAQTNDAVKTAVIAAHVHGVAAEIASAGRPVRGVTLDDVLAAMTHAWRLPDEELGEGELAALPAVTDG